MDFRFKPGESNNNAVTVLLPGQYSGGNGVLNIIDAQGNIVATGGYRHDYTEDGSDRPIFDFDVSAGDLPVGSQVQYIPQGGQPIIFNPADGVRDGEPLPGGGSGGGGGQYDAAGNLVGGASGTTGGYGGAVGTTPNGNYYAIPGAYNFNNVHTPYVDYNSILGDAKALGNENKDAFFGNITGDAARDAALGLVTTDVKGIIAAGTDLSNFNREQGNQDTATNISRAETIDAANKPRISESNNFNRGEVSTNNTFNQSERSKAVASSGLDYAGRITEVLDQLKDQTKGRLSGEMDALLQKDLNNRGAEIAASSGVGGFSGAGTRVRDRLTIGERVGISNDAQKTLSGVLTQAQQVLQSPEERAPTIFDQPTQIPLNTSNVADRLPVTSSVSAGSAQLSIGDKATDIQTIDAEHAFDNQLNTSKFNEESQFQRDLAVGDRIQSQLDTATTATNAAIGSDKADAIRNQAYQAFGAGVSQQIASGNATAAGASGGVQYGIQASQPQFSQNPIAMGAQSLGAVGTIASGLGGIINGISSAADSIFGDGDGVISVGGTPINGSSFSSFGDALSNFFGQGKPSTYSGSQGIEDVAFGGGSRGSSGQTFGDGTIDSQGRLSVAGGGSSGEPSAVNAFAQAMQPFEDSGIDRHLLGQASQIVAGWDKMSPTQQLTSVADLGTSVLANRGTISHEEAADLNNVSSALNVLANPNSSSAEIAAATTQAALGAVTTSFTGSINEPTTIGGNRVIGSAAMPDGSQGWEVQDAQGNISTVGQQELVNSSNAMSALSAFAVLNSKAPTEQKAAALASIGIRGAAANGIISNVAAGNALAGLNVFNTAMNWDQMNPIQKAVSVMQTSGTVLNAAMNIGTSQTAAASANGALAFAAEGGTELAANSAATTASSTLGTASAYLGGAAVIGGVILGVDQAADTLSAIKGMPRSQSVTQGAIGGAMAGATIGGSIGSLAGPLGTVAGIAGGAQYGAMFGAVAGLTGSGKNSGRMMRDSWRKSLQANGFIGEGASGKYSATLADGSTYDMGADGDFKLQNKGVNIDGNTERNTFDVDWSNEVAVATIPEAHLYAIATGIDPLSAGKFDTFDRAVAQSLNGATSNATTVDGVRANFRAMMGDKMDPRQLAMRLETLRSTNSISEQEYGTLLDRTNKIFGTQLQPSDRKQVSDFLIQSITEKGKSATRGEKELLETLQDPRQLAKNAERVAKREQTSESKSDNVKNTAIPKAMGMGLGLDGAVRDNLGANRNTDVPDLVSGLYPKGSKGFLTDDPEVRAAIKVESSGKSNALSPKGAQGLMQLMPKTGAEWHKKLGLPGKYNPNDPEQNVKIGTAYKDWLKGKYKGSTELAFAAYNWGPKKLDDLIKQKGTDDWKTLAKYVPEETRNHVQRVMSAIG